MILIKKFKTETDEALVKAGDQAEFLVWAARKKQNSLSINDKAECRWNTPYGTGHAGNAMLFVDRRKILGWRQWPIEIIHKRYRAKQASTWWKVALEWSESRTVTC